VTAKSSICDGMHFVNRAFHAANVRGLTPGDLHGAQGRAEPFERKVIAMQKSAKDVVGVTVDAEGPHEGG
jgi:phage FluMu protein gp41